MGHKQPFLTCLGPALTHAHTCAAGSALFVDLLGVRCELRVEELIEALDALSSAVMDGELPSDARRAFTLNAASESARRVHDICTCIYERLASSGDAVGHSLDGDFYDRRLIFVPQGDGAGAEDARFSTSEDVYWFATSGEEAELAAAAGLHALAPHYPAALRPLFVDLLHVSRKPVPSTSRLLETLDELASAPPTAATARLTQACARLLAGRDLSELQALVADASIGCPKHGPHCTHPACNALSTLARRAHGRGSEVTSGGSLLGDGPTDARTMLQRASRAVEGALARVCRCSQPHFQRTLPSGEGGGIGGGIGSDGSSFGGGGGGELSADA
eukprot:1464881-Prymnesium_polylepis.2